MGFKNVAFLAFRTRFSTTFIKNCGRGECLGTTTCPMTVVGGKQGHALRIAFSNQQSPYFDFHGDHLTQR